MLISKIVSGGQTGVDRGAIAAARELGKSGGMYLIKRESFDSKGGLSIDAYRDLSVG